MKFNKQTRVRDVNQKNLMHEARLWKNQLFIKLTNKQGYTHDCLQPYIPGILILILINIIKIGDINNKILLKIWKHRKTYKFTINFFFYFAENYFLINYNPKYSMFYFTGKFHDEF